MSVTKQNRILSAELGAFQSGCSSLVPYSSMRDHCPVPSSEHDGKYSHGLTNEISMYDASPTALYIYEQEKNDMQCLAPLSSPTSFIGSPSMDLPELKQTDVSNCLWGDKPACSWSLDDDVSPDDLLNMSEIHDLGQINIDEVFQRDQGPTLAELNGPALSAILNSNESSQEAWTKAADTKTAFQAVQTPSTEIEASIKKEWDALHDPREAKRRQRRPSEVDKKWAELREFVDRSSEGKGDAVRVKQEPGTGTTVNCSQLRKFLLGDTDPEEQAKDWQVGAKREHEATVVKSEPTSNVCEAKSPDAAVKSEVPVVTPSDDDSELDEDHDWSSDDNDSLDSVHDDRPSSSKRRRKEPRFFWQYNAQSKGPKGTRLYIPTYEEDPHVLHVFEDPVFDPEQTSSGNIRHSGKARRGDGNDIMPCPMKLHQIGDELKKLNRVIDQLTPAGDAPVNVKTRSKREKNKLASRACRLKKKAQHEANKIKLHGLEEEHGQLIRVLQLLRHEMVDHVTDQYRTKDASMTDKAERLIKANLKSMIAGHTTEFVNSVLEKTTAGDHSGGLRRKIY